MNPETAGPNPIALARRSFLSAAAVTIVLALPGCATIKHYAVEHSVRRLMTLSAERAFARLMAPGGFWDNQFARLRLPGVLGRSGNVLTDLLTSAVFKDRLQREFNHIAEKGARKAAPLVAEVVEKIGIDNSKAILAGGPTAATLYLRNAMAGSLIAAMSPELGEALRISQDPLVGQALAKLTGVDLPAMIRNFATDIDAAIWGEIGRQEAEIRADPKSTHDPELIEVLGVA